MEESHSDTFQDVSNTSSRPALPRAARNTQSRKSILTESNKFENFFQNTVNTDADETEPFKGMLFSLFFKFVVNFEFFLVFTTDLEPIPGCSYEQTSNRRTTKRARKSKDVEKNSNKTQTQKTASNTKSKGKKRVSKAASEEMTAKNVQGKTVCYLIKFQSKVIFIFFQDYSELNSSLEERPELKKQKPSNQHTVSLEMLPSSQSVIVSNLDETLDLTAATTGGDEGDLIIISPKIYNPIYFWLQN